MSYKVSEQRNATMLKRIGDAADLIDDKRYLPFYRGVQIRLEKAGKADEWAKMIETAKEKSNPKHYFAMICKMVRDGTYKFAEKVKGIERNTRLWLSDKIVKFGFGKYQNYWVRKASEFIHLNSQADFIELLEYAERKGISQKYFAAALKNGKPPRKYYQENVLGGAKA